MRPDRRQRNRAAAQRWGRLLVAMGREQRAAVAATTADAAQRLPERDSATDTHPPAATPPAEPKEQTWTDSDNTRSTS